MNSKKIVRDCLCLLVCVIWLGLPSSATAQEGEQVAAVETKAASVNWRPRIEYARLVLTISMPDGQVFHVITRGSGMMPAYGGQIAPDDRWKA